MYSTVFHSLCSANQFLIKQKFSVVWRMQIAKQSRSDEFFLKNVSFYPLFRSKGIYFFLFWWKLNIWYQIENFTLPILAIGKSIQKMIIWNWICLSHKEKARRFLSKSIARDKYFLPDANCQVICIIKAGRLPDFPNAENSFLSQL